MIFDVTFVRSLRYLWLMGCDDMLTDCMMIVNAMNIQQTRIRNA
jgi:hypothetical protein